MNFRIGQKVRCIKRMIPENYEDDSPQEGRVYTVESRSITKFSTLIALKEINGSYSYYPSDCFECAEVMEDADKHVNDLIRSDGWVKIKDIPEFNPDDYPMQETPSTVHLCMSDNALKNEWKQSVKNEQYEKSQVYWDEMKERKLTETK